MHQQLLALGFTAMAQLFSCAHSGQWRSDGFFGSVIAL